MSNSPALHVSLSQRTPSWLKSTNLSYSCGLAMAESERYLPTLISKLEDTIVEAGLRNASIVMRMTGCPNGCARPWVAELACVGKAPGTYNLMLGGGYHGQRLNKLYR